MTDWKETPEGKSVLEQPRICSFPEIPGFRWMKKRYENRFSDKCALHDYRYVVRTGDRGDRSIVRYIWDEEKKRLEADSELFKNQWQTQGLKSKAWSLMTYPVVRLFGWIAWWNILEKDS
jgi:hypothetical protein